MCKSATAGFVSKKEMTREEKIKMYSKFTKRELIEMLIEANSLVNRLAFSSSGDMSVGSPYKHYTPPSFGDGWITCSGIEILQAPE